MAGRRRKVGAVRPDQRKPTKLLEAPTEAVEVPELPDADEWISADRWPQPVIAWWSDVFASPMAGEYAESDIHGLYVAASYLAESLNPKHNAAERLKLAQSWEHSLKVYGLTPTARENLRWSISQGEAAERRTRDLRERKTTTVSQPTLSNEVNADIIALYRQQG